MYARPAGWSTACLRSSSMLRLPSDSRGCNALGVVAWRMQDAMNAVHRNFRWLRPVNKLSTGVLAPHANGLPGVRGENLPHHA